MMQRELIEKYFSNECSDDERRQVLEYFRDNPGEWDRYMNEADWESFESDGEVPPELSARMHDAVMPKRRRRVVMRVAAAVVVILVVGVTGSLWTPKARYVVQELVRTGMKERKNDTDQQLTFQLDDGTFVTLAARSSIKYPDPFIKREVYVDGKVTFMVEKDEDHFLPFIVYADRLATTVLGTVFVVEAAQQSNVVKVMLLEGKVQVSPAYSVNGKWNGKEVLYPGDEFLYNKGTMIAHVKRKEVKEEMVRAAYVKQEGVHVRRPDSYTFGAAPLSEVFDQLSNYYQVEIYYYPSEVDNFYYSGTMRKTDKLETILNDIAKLDQLTIEKDHDRYVIRKESRK